MYIGHPTLDPLNPLREADDYQAFLNVMLKNPGAFSAYYFDYEMEPYQITVLKLAAGFPITFEESEIYAKEDYRWNAKNKKSLILLPAGHGKSTLICKVLPIFELCRNPNIRMIMIMKNDKDVGKYSTSIRKILETDAKLIRDFGPFKPSSDFEPWNSEAINVYKRKILDEHNTIEFFGAGGSILGHRCDFAIMDDIVTDKNSNTAEQRDKYEKWFDETVATAPRYQWPRDERGRIKIPDGIYWPPQEEVYYERLVVCGTTFHPEDLYYKLKNDKNYNYVRYDCWKDGDPTKPLSPKLMPIERLKEEEESAGPISFARRYRNIAYNEEEMGFQRSWVYGGEWHGVEFPGCLDRERSWGEYPSDAFVAVGFDPATGRGRKNNTWPSYVVLAADDEFEEGKDRFQYYLVDIFRRMVGLEDQISVLLDGDSVTGLPGFYTQYNYDIAVVETNSFCTWVMDHHRIKEATNPSRGPNRANIKGYDNQKKKEDAEMNVLKMQPLFMNGLISIPYKTPQDQLKAKELIDQLLLFPKGVHDYCMAMWFAYIGAEKRKNTLKSFYRPGFSGKFVKNPAYFSRSRLTSGVQLNDGVDN